MIRKSSKSNGSIRHYTDVDALFKILDNGLMFSRPRPTWDDKNDYYTLHKYEELKQKDVYVLCFCNEIGNTHHWSYFGSNKYPTICAGCFKSIKCNIKLNRAKFEEKLAQRHLSLKDIIYCKSTEISQKLLSIEDLPLLKKNEYCIENELRVLAIVNQGSKRPDNIQITPECIEGISILLPNSSTMYKQLKKELNTMYPKIIIKFSGVRNSPRWKTYISNQLKKI